MGLFTQDVYPPYRDHLPGTQPLPVPVRFDRPVYDPLDAHSFQHSIDDWDVIHPFDFCLVICDTCHQYQYRQSFFACLILTNGQLQDVIFTKANLADANLNKANLNGGKFSEANLKNVNFADANLQEAQDLTDKQLAQANTLLGATMPGGRRYNGRFNLTSEIVTAHLR